MTSSHIKNYHLGMRSRYSTVGIMLGGRCFGLDPAGDDDFLQELLTLRYPSHDFDLLPRGEVWFAPAPTDDVSAATSDASVQIITTAYNAKHQRNRQTPKALRDDPAEWTKRERVLAEAAERPATMEDFIDNINESLRQGWKKEGKYVLMPAALSLHTDILLYGVTSMEDDLICFRLSDDTISQEKKDQLYLHVQDLTKVGDERVDSRLRPDGFNFKAWHIGWWNKMAWTGKQKQRSRKCSGKRQSKRYSKCSGKKHHVRARVANVTQSQPYYDRSAVVLEGDFDEEHFNHSAFHEVLAGVVEPVIAKLKQQLPELMGLHAEFSASLGPTFTVGCAPFCMAVLNIQPVTNGHRDTSDPVDSICVVMALGDFTGGELCLYAPGLVIELPHGSCVAIRSKRDIHFNLHFKGQRFSFVFTSDKSLKRWAEESNHWEELQSSQPQGAEDNNDQDWEDEEENQDVGEEDKEEEDDTEVEEEEEDQEDEE
ncbi:hypothetical protein FRC07_000424 [Ceratobasidium sp. 392]|nr:hypothetical protein FRC07_000424 [Ceratobasidium sp. 392]